MPIKGKPLKANMQLSLTTKLMKQSMKRESSQVIIVELSSQEITIICIYTKLRASL